MDAALQEHAPHVAAAWQYAQDVVAGELIACKLTQQACQRMLSDLECEDAPWHLDATAAENACNFIETLPHIKGEWAKRRELLVLQGWQCFIVVNTFGWLMNDSGLRRFRTVYIEVARKNAKSTLAAAIALYMLTEDGEAGAEVYSAATTRNQAKIVFNIARQMAKRTAAMPVEVRVHNINYLEEASLFEALHAQGETLDGYNIHCAINDELHAWKSKDVYDVIETATGARRQPLIFNITTAGHNTAGICYQLRTYLTRILKNDIEDDSFFGIIYTLDKDDDWTDRKLWPKANPNYGVSVYPMDMEALARKAADMPSAQNGFLMKRLNVWVGAAEAWMNMRLWAKTYDPTLTVDDFAGEECYAGTDLASKIDVNSQARLFCRDEADGKTHYYAFMAHWLPEAAIEDDPNGLYDGWVRSGDMRTTPGNMIDVDRIEADTLEEVASVFDLKQLGVDPGHNSTQYGVHMAEENIEVVDVRPSVLNFSEAMKWLEAWVKDGTFHHCCPVLTWMVGNVEIKRDQKDNIYPRKGAVNRKIDGVIALLIAIHLHKMAQDSDSTVYDNRGVIVV